MASPHLPNYLRRHRKRLSFSQDEIAFLLGAENGTKVCRYERFARTPSLETAFACEALFGTPASELFPGLYQQSERKVMERAKRLLARLERAPDAHNARKRKLLAIISGQDIQKR